MRQNTLFLFALFICGVVVGYLIPHAKERRQQTEQQLPQLTSVGPSSSIPVQIQKGSIWTDNVVLIAITPEGCKLYRFDDKYNTMGNRVYVLVNPKGTGVEASISSESY